MEGHDLIFAMFESMDTHDLVRIRDSYQQSIININSILRNRNHEDY